MSECHGFFPRTECCVRAAELGLFALPLGLDSRCEVSRGESERARHAKEHSTLGIDVVTHDSPLKTKKRVSYARTYSISGIFLCNNTFLKYVLDGNIRTVFVSILI